jgi:hypothetical protein
MRSLVFRSTGRNRFDAVRSFRDCHAGDRQATGVWHPKIQTNPENTAGRVSAGPDIRGQTTYLGILERFVSARERCLDGMWRRFNLTYTRGSTNGSTQMFLSVHRSKTNITAASTSYAPAEMDRARVKTMHVILVCTQTFTQLTLDNAEACIALMEGMIDVASTEHERTQISDITTKEVVTLGFCTCRDTNIHSRRPVERWRDRMATRECIALE